MNFLLFYVQLLYSINFCFGPFEMWQCKNNCSGLKIDWGSHPCCSYLQNAYSVITFCCFTHIFCRLSLQTTDNGVVSGM